MKPGGSRLDAIERQVRNAILNVETRWRSLGNSDAKWTRAIKNAVGRVGTRLGYQVCAAESRYYMNGEWLYDLAWVQLERGEFVSLPLVLESEWTQDEELMYDFQKLVAARAGHRVMVFWATSPQSAERQIEKFIRQIERFRSTQKDDGYLFAWYSGSDNDRGIEFRGYVAKKNAAQQPR